MSPVDQAGDQQDQAPRPQITTTPWKRPPEHVIAEMESDVVLDLGWGRLVFGQTFADHAAIERELRDEALGRRDIALYVRDPHVLVARWPRDLFVDPSFTYRMDLLRPPPRAEPVPGIVVRLAASRDDCDDANRIYVRCGMVSAPVSVMWENHRERPEVDLLVAESTETGQVVGTVTGVDHERLFGDPEGGSSLWCLAVDPACPVPGVGEALVLALLDRYGQAGRAYLDLSVMHDNRPAVALYEKLGFERVPVYVVKRKNAINEPLFGGNVPDDLEHCNPYARIVADEALRRGIAVEVLDADAGFLALSHGGRRIVTRESLSELTTAVAMSRCDDKRITRKILAGAGIAVPRGRTASRDEADDAFLAEVGDLVVKPTRGEQGRGVTVGVTNPEELRAAVEHASEHCPEVLIEERWEGEDLRVLVIDQAVVAAAVRRPAVVVGNGSSTVRHLIEAQSRRRAAATAGESTIPLDEVTEATVRAGGFTYDDVLPAGTELPVRRTANLHTGGTIHDVTAELHPELAEAAVRAAEALAIPVVGIDLIVPHVGGPEYVCIEANERPGLANHDPQPTAERFIDLLFPATRAIPRGWEP